MNQDWVADFLASEALTQRFRRTIELVCEPLADHAARLRRRLRRPVLVGLCGAQGSGKSTIAAATVKILQSRGLSAVTISLDDFYLPRSARERLAREVHPLFVTRGPPGTHDVTLAGDVLDRLRRPGRLALPAFDKAADEPRPPTAWPRVDTPVDVVIFEGWCVGARPQALDALAPPVNALEAQEDPQGIWRAYVNAALGGPYQDLFARLDAFALLQASSFEVVLGWRLEQERKLIARTGRGMDDAQVARFVAHYERLTRWILAEAPGRADLVFRLAPNRSPITIG